MSKSMAIHSSKPKQKRLAFASHCVAQVFPSSKESLMPKARIIDRAARLGRTLDECPDTFHSVDTLRTYMRNKWSAIRLMIPKEHNFVPVYVNGPKFGGGGGFRKGDAKHVQKQLLRDAKITDGVLNAANEFADGAINVFPKLEANRVHLVARLIDNKKK